MAKLILITKIRVGGRLHWPGKIFDTAQDDVTSITEAGARLISANVTSIAIAAVRATTLKLRGDTIDAAEAVMIAAANSYDAGRMTDIAADLGALAADVATLQATVDGLGGGSSRRIVESLRLDVSYSAFAFLASMSPVYNAGVINDTTACAAQEPLFQYLVPQIVVGDSQQGVFEGTGHTSAGPAVTVTVTGEDVTGTQRSCVFTTNGANVYQPDAGTAFALKTPVVRVQTSASLERKLGIYSGKGFALAGAFVDEKLEIGASGTTTTLDTPTRVHGASGTVVPSFEYNASEVTVFARYQPA